MLSGKAFVPGMGIESSRGGVARTEKLRPNIKTASSSEHRNFISSPRSLSSPPASSFCGYLTQRNEAVQQLAFVTPVVACVDLLLDRSTFGHGAGNFRA